MLLRHSGVIVAVLAAALVSPASAAARTERVFFQHNSIVPLRIWEQVAAIPAAVSPNSSTTWRYRSGATTYVGEWNNFAFSTKTATFALGILWSEGRERFTDDGVFADRVLTASERRRFTVLADLYREADVLALAAGHPACSGLTRDQARRIVRGAVTRWSDVTAMPAGDPEDAIVVAHPLTSTGVPEPHLGVPMARRGARALYAPGARGAADAGVGRAASGDRSVAAITTWSRVRRQPGSVCVVPLDGVAPTDETVLDLRYPEAFPVQYVVIRKRPRLPLDRVERRVMTKHLRSNRVKHMLRGKGVLIPGEPPPAT